MAKKKNKAVIRPWCWYCEREFEDEKVLMQHQKAKHFKCGMCPRRLNTAGGLAVHIQQVHKLEPENLPRIENAIQGRDGYEVEIFGMEGIPARDVADYKRRKEIELGLAAGSITQPQAKKPRYDNRPLTEDELRVQLAAHKALMGASEGGAAPPPDPAAAAAVYNAAPQTYAVPPPGALPVAGPIPGGPPMGMPFPPPMPGQPPFPPAGMPGFSLGGPPSGFPPFPPLPGTLPPPGMPPLPGMSSFPPGGALPPFPPPMHGAPGGPPPGVLPPFPPPSGLGIGGPPHASAPPPAFVPSSSGGLGATGTPVPSSTPPVPTNGAAVVAPTQPSIPLGVKPQTLPDFKKSTALKHRDPNFSPEEKRAFHPKYRATMSIENEPPASGADAGSRGVKRARAEDFL